MSLPTLPEPWRTDADGEEHYSPVCMKAYGQQCRDDALEEAATWIDFYDGQGLRRAEHIRSIK